MALAIIALPMLSACGGELSALQAGSAEAASITRLWWVMFAGACVLLALVLGLFVRVARASDTPRSRKPGRWLFWGAGVLPALVLPPLVGYGLWVGEQQVRAARQVDVEVEVIARQWTWAFRYPQLHPDTVFHQLHLPAGRSARLHLHSEDVIHSLWIPNLGGKLDVIPGMVNTLHLRPEAPGRHRGQCAEFCGSGHAQMRFEVIVHPADGFAEALAQEATR